MDNRSPIWLFLNPWVILGSIFIALVLFGVTALAIWVTKPGKAAPIPATPIITIIPAPTATLPAATNVPTPEASPTQATMPTPLPGVISVGSLVKIVGTGGDGLRVRSEAGLNGKIVFVAIDNEIFKIKDGPRDIDGYTWWYLVALYDDKYQGWAVSNYLSVQNP